MQATREAMGVPTGLDIEAIARDHYDAVFRFCARRVGVDRAADAAQETFLTAQRVVGKYRGESAVSTWIIGIAHNECRRLARKHRMEILPLEFDTPHPRSATEQRLVDREALQQAMRGLSPEHREAVTLHELEGLTYEEAAGILGVPVGTVKSRLHHAFVNLRRALFPEEVRVGEVRP